MVDIFPPSAQHLSTEGICSYKDEHSIIIRTHAAISSSFTNTPSLCVQLRFDDRSFLLQEKGLQKAIEHESPLKDALLGSWTLSIPDKVKSRSSLNTSQSTAIDTFLNAKNLSIIHGPPGTGKTHTIVQLCKLLIDKNKRIWVLAESNAAVDHLCSTLKTINTDPLRLGSRYRISTTSWNLTSRSNPTRTFGTDVN